MGWESFGVVGFDLGPLLQGQMYLQGQTRIGKLKSAYNSLIIRRINLEVYWMVNQPIGNHGLGVFWCGQI